jgi:hypothetical protein
MVGFMVLAVESIQGGSMAGHSQNRLSSVKGECPHCHKKGLGKEKQHWNPLRGELHSWRECRYCHERCNVIITLPSCANKVV